MDPRGLRNGLVRTLLIGLGVAALAGCGKGRDWRQSQAAAPPPEAEADAGYIRPPQVLTAARTPDGGVALSGEAEPNSRVRLQTPQGDAYGGTVTPSGAWSMPTAAGAAIFGLSEDLGGRIVQGEGYVVILPAPGRPAALLRAGGGAAALGDSGSGVRIAAADFDSGGGAVISGFAPAGAALKLSMDGAAAPGEVKADGQGRFFIASPAVLKPGRHQIRVQSGAQAAQADIAVGPPGPISGQPFRAARQGGAWRVDWMTPGGGVQTSLILDP